MAKKRKEKNIVERARATVCLLNAGWGDKQKEMFAFLAIFHPEISLEKRLKMCK
jgi:hypothetical protein